MDQNFFAGMMYNAALLMALGIVFDSITLRNLPNKLLAKIITGIILGAITLAIMLNPFVLKPGVVFDTRSIMLSLTGMFFGIIPTLIAAAAALAYRINQGGAGVYMGCAVIIASILWGMLWKKLHKKWDKPYTYAELYLLGLVNHLTMLSLTLLLPKAIRGEVFNSIALPVIVIYPIVTVLLGMLMGRKIQRRLEKFDLEERERQFRNLFDNSPLPYQSLDLNGNIIAVNSTWLATLGYAKEEVVGKNFAEFLGAQSKELFSGCFPKFKNAGQADEVEFTMLKKNGQAILVSFNGKIVYHEDGSFMQTQCVFIDITEHRKQEAALKSIEWMLTKQDVELSNTQNYGDLTELNQGGLILSSVGKEVLAQLVTDYLSLLDTSSAVYEKNGVYAMGIFSSGWCRFLDIASRNLCETDDNAQALESSKWLCHESCWTDVSKKAIETGEVVDLQCNGCVHLYAVPIKTSSGVIGAINVGYGNPPLDELSQREIATKYNLSLEEVKAKASEYQTRPLFIIEQAKSKLHTAAKIIAEIVERKQAELKLIKIKQDWESIFQSIPHPTLILDKDQNVIAANVIVEKALGMTSEQIQNRKCWELMHGEDVHQPPVGCPFSELNSQNISQSEMEVELLNGYYLVYCKAILDKNGEIERVIHIAMDITERKKAEIALRESEARFKQFMNQIPGKVFIKDKDSRIVFVNKYMEDIYGAAEWVGKLPDEILKPELAQEVLENDKEVLGKGLIQMLDKSLDLKGNEHYLETTKFTINREEHEPLIGGLSLDVTNKVLAEQERNLYAQRLEILHNIDTGILEAKSLEQICQTSLDSLHRLLPSFRCSIVVWGESKAEWLLFILEDGVYKTKTLEFNPVDFTDNLAAGEIFYIPDALNYSGELSEYRQNLMKQDIISHLHIPLIMKGEFFGTLNFGDKAVTDYPQDILDTLKDIANQMTIAIQQMHLTKEIAKYAEGLEAKIAERTEQLKHAVKELESFSYTVAHDLRSPLRSIDGFANMLLEDYTDKLDDEGKHRLDVIKNNAIKMDTLIKELLELAKINPNSLKPRELDMNKIVASILDNDVAKETRALFDIEVSDLPKAYADHTLIEQVWLNLITNAIKFTIPKEDKKLIIGSFEKAGQVVYFVQDNGVGFDMKYVDKIFGAFQRLHKSTEFEGTGIGLAIVYKIIQRHNGAIWVESEVEKGTTFYFTLPEVLA
jgi:PAS domain S-box-containing protein